MRTLTSLMRKFSWGSLATAMWLATAQTAWAAGADEGSGPGDYVFSYFLVVIFVGSAVAVVCAPSRRRDKLKPDEYAQKKLV